MSDRERAVAMIDSFPDDQLGNVIAMLQTMKQAIEDALTANIPNETTIAPLLTNCWSRASRGRQDSIK